MYSVLEAAKYMDQMADVYESSLRDLSVDINTSCPKKNYRT